MIFVENFASDKPTGTGTGTAVLASLHSGPLRAHPHVICPPMLSKIIEEAKGKESHEHLKPNVRGFVYQEFPNDVMKNRWGDYYVWVTLIPPLPCAC